MTEPRTYTDAEIAAWADPWHKVDEWWRMVHACPVCGV